MELDKKQQRLIKLAKHGGTDKELAILDFINELEEKFDEVMKEMKEHSEEKMMEMKDMMPNFQELIASIFALAEKELPQPVINIPETKIEVKAPIINVESPNVEVAAPIVNVPPPTVNVTAEKKVEIDTTTKDAITQLQESLEEVKKELETTKSEAKKGRQAYGPGKTQIRRVDLSTQLNGVLKTFYLGTHFGIISVSGSSAPFTFRETVDYVESGTMGRSITFTDNVDAAISLATGQTLIVKILR